LREICCGSPVNTHLVVTSMHGCVIFTFVHCQVSPCFYCFPHQCRNLYRLRGDLLRPYTSHCSVNFEQGELINGCVALREMGRRTRSVFRPHPVHHARLIRRQAFGVWADPLRLSMNEVDAHDCEFRNIFHDRSYISTDCSKQHQNIQFRIVIFYINACVFRLESSVAVRTD
jgi:hypothetical protein